MTKAKILVTGATGNTGAIVVDELLAKGFAVRALVRRHDTRSAALAQQGGRARRRRHVRPRPAARRAARHPARLLPADGRSLHAPERDGVRGRRARGQARSGRPDEPVAVAPRPPSANDARDLARRPAVHDAAEHRARHSQSRHVRRQLPADHRLSRAARHLPGADGRQPNARRCRTRTWAASPPPSSPRPSATPGCASARRDRR